ncbi:MAG: hypothetical protein JJE16_09485 [Nitrospiraceae bacterium]|nr:hypothetical protein [Nitrospiraceae bacterium]
MATNQIALLECLGCSTFCRLTEAESGRFATRPSGTENSYKIYAESFRGADHLRHILEEAQTIVGDALAASPQQPGSPSKLKQREH